MINRISKIYFRLVCLLIIIIFFYLFTLLFYWLVPKNKWVYVSRALANSILFVVGIKIDIDGELSDHYVNKNQLVIANHISWLDIPVLYSIKFLGFIAKQEMRKWPILNLLISTNGTIYINRNKKTDLKRVNQIVSKKLVLGNVIGLFPEGRTTEGKEVIPFKAPILQAAIMAKSIITPFVIRYYKKDGSIAFEASYAGKISLWKSVSNVLSIDGLVVKVKALPHVKAEDYLDREFLSSYLHQNMSESFKQLK
jgi:1-acyl-sn-glycerol-3-phosphate acyltransferase